jgi:predicted XRE-type DNA-binding protein
MKKSERKAEIAAEIAALEAGEPVHVDGPYANLWEAICDTPEEAANMTLRSDLMRAIKLRVRGWGLTQKKAAKRLGVTQPRLNALLKGRLSEFSLDALVNLAVRAGLAVHFDLRLPEESLQPELEPA